MKAGRKACDAISGITKTGQYAETMNARGALLKERIGDIWSHG